MSSAAGLSSKSRQWNRKQEGDGLDGKAERSSRKELRELSTVIFDDLTQFFCVCVCMFACVLVCAFACLLICACICMLLLYFQVLDI